MVSIENVPVLNQIYGREDELNRIHQILERGEAACLLLVGDGGVGKTRLLRECQKRLPNGTLFPPIYDFYHVDNFKASQIEAEIIETVYTTVEGADFQDYQRQRQKLVRARQSGTQFLEARRELRNMFVSSYNAAAALAHEQGRTIRLLFDTVEQAVNLTDPAEHQLVSSEHSASDGGEFWLKEIVPQLKNTIVILSGRPQTLYHQPVTLYEELAARMTVQREDLRGIPQHAIERFVEEIRIHYTEAVHGEWRERARNELDQDFITVCSEVSNGQPFWLAMFFTCWILQVMPAEVDDLFETYRRTGQLTITPDTRDIVRNAIRQAILGGFNDDVNLDSYILALQWMAYARKGLNRDMLQRLLNGVHVRYTIERDADRVFEHLRHLLIVKTRATADEPRSRRSKDATKKTQPQVDERLFLHDEMYFWLDQDQRATKHTSEDVHTTLVQWYDETIRKVEQDRQRMIDALLAVRPESKKGRRLQKQVQRSLQHERQLVLDRLGYYYQIDPDLGRFEYNLRSYAAIIEREYGYGITLRQEDLRNLYRLDPQVSFPVEVECAARWILRAVLAEDREQVEQMLPKLAYYYKQEQQQPGLHYALLYLAEAMALIDFQLLGGSKPIIQCLERATTIVQEDIVNTPWHDVLLSQILNWHGVFYRRTYQLHNAVEKYGESLACAARHPTLLPELMAPTLNNLAFALSEQGDVAEARYFARSALQQNRYYGTEYYVGLSYNTLARIEIRSGLVRRAQRYAKKARAIFKELDSPRGLSFCLPVLAETYRKIAEQLDDDIPFQDQTFAKAEKIFRKSLSLLKRERIKSTERWRESYQGLGCTYRSIGQMLLRRRLQQEARQTFVQAREYLQKALHIAQSGEQPRLILLDILEDLAVIHISQDEFDGRSSALLDQAEAYVPPEYFLQPGRGLQDVPRPMRGFWRELGQCQLQRMLSSFGAYDIGYTYLDEGGNIVTQCKDPKDLEAAAYSMVYAFAYLVKYNRSSTMLERVIELTLRELRAGRTEAQIKQLAFAAHEAAQEYNLLDSEAFMLIEGLLQQARHDFNLQMDGRAAA